MTKSIFAKLPSVDTVIISEPIKSKYQNLEINFLSFCARKVLDKIRKDFQQHPDKFQDKSREELLETVSISTIEKIENLLESSLKYVVNGTGVILHTGLGRAPFSKSAQKNITDVVSNYSNIELDLSSGKRGERLEHVEEILCFLSKSESAAVVNNNAAAVLIALNTFAKGKEVIVSRGQLIEIGGSFRLPDVFEQSGAIMKEVGTTNKTKLQDYEKAINENTGAILIAHSSNYRVLGFTEEVPIADLVSLTKKQKISLIYDLGGGVFLDLVKFNLPYEPVVSENVKLGVDVVTFSGDKVLGGPQSGILVGKKSAIRAIRENPMMRALRCDKLIYAALEATLKSYLDPEKRVSELPVFRMLLEKLPDQEQRIQKLCDKTKGRLDPAIKIKIEEGSSEIGSGALPLEEIPSMVLRIEMNNQSPIKTAQHFRNGKTPIIGYIKDEGFYLNFRTIRDDELNIISEKIISLV